MRGLDQHSPTLKYRTIRPLLPLRNIQVLNLASHRGSIRHGKQPPNAALRTQPRNKIISRIAELKLKDFEAAEKLSVSAGQISRLKGQEDIFTLDRLIDAAAKISMTVRMTATRPYRQR